MSGSFTACLRLAAVPFKQEKSFGAGTIQQNMLWDYCSTSISSLLLSVWVESVSAFRKKNGKEKERNDSSVK